MGKNNSGRLDKTGNDEVRPLVEFLGITKINEHGPQSGPSAAIDVAPAISDHPRSCEVEIESGRRVEYHSWFWFASSGRFAAAGIVTDFDAVDRGDELAQAQVHGFDDALLLRTTTDIRLVGDNNEGITRSLQRVAIFTNALEESKICQGLGWIGFAIAHALHVQRAIAIEENSR